MASRGHTGSVRWVGVIFILFTFQLCFWIALNDASNCRTNRLYQTPNPSLFVTALVHSRLDYCNVVFAGLPACDIQRLQSVLNTAVSLVAGSSRCDHVTSLLSGRHWLPVKQRVEYKLCTMVHRCLYGDAPTYLADLILSLIHI